MQVNKHAKYAFLDTSPSRKVFYVEDAINYFSTTTKTIFARREKEVKTERHVLARSAPPAPSVPTVRVGHRQADRHELLLEERPSSQIGMGF